MNRVRFRHQVSVLALAFVGLAGIVMACGNSEDVGERNNHVEGLQCLRGDAFGFPRLTTETEITAFCNGTTTNDAGQNPYACRPGYAGIPNCNAGAIFTWVQPNGQTTPRSCMCPTNWAQPPAAPPCPAGATDLGNACGYTVTADVASYIANQKPAYECCLNPSSPSSSFCMQGGDSPNLFANNACPTISFNAASYYQFCVGAGIASGSPSNYPRGHTGVTGVWSCPKSSGGMDGGSSITGAKLVSSNAPTGNPHPPQMGYELSALKIPFLWGTYTPNMTVNDIGIGVGWMGHPNSVPNDILAANASNPSRGAGDIWADLNVDLQCNNGKLELGCTRLSGSKYPNQWGKVTINGETKFEETNPSYAFCQLFETTGGKVNGGTLKSTPACPGNLSAMCTSYPECDKPGPASWPLVQSTEGDPGPNFEQLCFAIPKAQRTTANPPGPQAGFTWQTNTGTCKDPTGTHKQCRRTPVGCSAYQDW